MDLKSPAPAHRMPLDLILRQGRLVDSHERTVDIGIGAGHIVEIADRIVADAPAEQLDGRLVIPGFVESHIHLDKSCILDRCHNEKGTLAEAIAAVAAAKRSFTEDDIYARARRTLEKAIVQGTTRMRTHVEIDPRVGLKGFHALQRLARDYAWAIDLQICAFPQEGLTNDPGAEKLLVEACAQGADLIGGCPYTDTDPNAQIARIFAIARRFDLDIDFHLDFDIDPSWMHLDEVCRQTDAHRWGGRVAIGHVTSSPPSIMGASPRSAAASPMPASP
jgi:cytosine deaminase